MISRQFLLWQGRAIPACSSYGARCRSSVGPLFGPSASGWERCAGECYPRRRPAVTDPRPVPPAVRLRIADFGHAGWLLATRRAADARALAALTIALARRESALPALGRSPVPVLLLAGQHDPQLPAIPRTSAQLRAATLAELPGCGHLGAFLRSDLTPPLVVPFLAECSAGR